jgi:hypothetical protein
MSWQGILQGAADLPSQIRRGKYVIFAPRELTQVGVAIGASCLDSGCCLTASC